LFASLSLSHTHSHTSIMWSEMMVQRMRDHGNSSGTVSCKSNTKTCSVFGDKLPCVCVCVWGGWFVCVCVCVCVAVRTDVWGVCVLVWVVCVCVGLWWFLCGWVGVGGWWRRGGGGGGCI